jgi:hypothetical protein
MIVYFQPKGIRKEFCEVGMISEKDPNYIWYLDEPCKVLITEVKIIQPENVLYNNKTKLYQVINKEIC